MSGSVNKVILIGNCGKDPEIKSFQSGDKIANLSIATSESWRDKSSGERKERTEWFNVVIRGEGLVKVVENYVKKGSKLYIEGQLQTRKWKDKDGNDRYSTEIVVTGFNGALTMLDSPSGERKSDNYDPHHDGAGSSRNPTYGNNDLDDSVPW